MVFKQKEFAHPVTAHIHAALMMGLIFALKAKMQPYIISINEF